MHVKDSCIMKKTSNVFTILSQYKSNHNCPHQPLSCLCGLNNPETSGVWRMYFIYPKCQKHSWEIVLYTHVKRIIRVWEMNIYSKIIVLPSHHENITFNTMFSITIFTCEYIISISISTFPQAKESAPAHLSSNPKRLAIFVLIFTKNIDVTSRRPCR